MNVNICVREVWIVNYKNVFFKKWKNCFVLGEVVKLFMVLINGNFFSFFIVLFFSWNGKVCFVICSWVGGCVFLYLDIWFVIFGLF